MSSCFGENLKLSIFGQSHANAIGMTLDGIAAGLPVDFARLQRFLDRRRPGNSALASARQETDCPEFLSGIVDGFTCGAPIAALIRNDDARSGDYAALADTPRPGHADLAARIKYGAFHDCAGGGHFSGRLTAPLCIAGGLCLQWLEKEGVHIGAHIIQVGTQRAQRFDPLAPQLDSIGHTFPTLRAEDAERFIRLIDAAKNDGDSVGGRIECAVTGLPAGLGHGMFGSMENRLSQALYAIPGVKNVGFGWSEEFAAANGSTANDPIAIVDGRAQTVSNHCGGILGGISTGLPLIFDVTLKPTPSIGKVQSSVSLSRMEPVQLRISGRHDACIALRAVPAVEAAAAIAVYDMLLSHI